MGVIEDIYADLDADVSEEEFREAVEAKVEQMGGLADEETAAMLIAHELDAGTVGGVADVEAGMEEVEFVAKVLSVGDLRSFERDGDRPEGRVLNAEVADETGAIRVTFWDEHAVSADEELEVGQDLRIAGRPQDGYNGVEVSVDAVEAAEDVELDVQVRDSYRVEDLSLGLSDVTLAGKVLDATGVRTFDRDDGSEGRVANLVVGDETGRVRITMWDDQANRATEIAPGTSVEVIDGYVRERDGRLELHVGDRGRVVETDETVQFRAEADPIAELEIGESADIAGVIRSADPVRTFDRDDGSEGQVRNVRLQDETGDVRVALWAEKADEDLGPGDEVLFVDVQVQEGWQDDVEASANWQSSVIHLEDGEAATARSRSEPAAESGGLAAFADGESADDESVAGAGSGADGSAGADDGSGAAASGDDGADGDDTADDTAGDDGGGTAGGGGSGTTADVEGGGPAEGDPIEFTGTVVQAGEPIILDDGRETMSVETDADVVLGQQVTVRGTYRDGRVDADEVV